MAKVDYDSDIASVLSNDSGLEVDMKIDGFAPQEYNKDYISSVFKAIDTTLSLASQNLKQSYRYVNNCNVEIDGLPMADLVEIPFLDVDIDSTLGVVPVKIDEIPSRKRYRSSEHSDDGDSVSNMPEETYLLFGNFVHGEEVSIISKNGSWYLVKNVNGEIGYIHENYVVLGNIVTLNIPDSIVTKSIEVPEGSTISIVKDLNNPNEVSAILKQNTIVEVLSEEGEWSKVRCVEGEGYVSTSILKQEVINETENNN